MASINIDLFYICCFMLCPIVRTGLYVLGSHLPLGIAIIDKLFFGSLQQSPSIECITMYDLQWHRKFIAHETSS
ncbi:hypothetical protein L218DRAFT_285051 [Marasmius fiardii PR-910]|nr:hypothetical protein L218DRAFT_285051 [Marasmius fiardii PR-910]